MIFCTVCPADGRWIATVFHGEVERWACVRDDEATAEADAMREAERHYNNAATGCAECMVAAGLSVGAARLVAGMPWGGEA